MLVGRPLPAPDWEGGVYGGRRRRNEVVGRQLHEAGRNSIDRREGRLCRHTEGQGGWENGKMGPFFWMGWGDFKSPLNFSWMSWR